jgi:hypothetical protein
MCKRKSSDNIEKHGDNYYIIDGRAIKSITSVLYDYFPSFDAQALADKIISSKSFDHDIKFLKYRECVSSNRRITRNNVSMKLRQNWKTRSSEGVLLHSLIEDFYNQPCKIRAKLGLVEFEHHFINFHKFTKEMKWEPLHSEWLIYSKYYDLAGSIDMVYRSPDNKLVIVDWKRCYQLYNSSDTYCKSSIEHVPNSNMYKYSVQLWLYKELIESAYDMIVGKLLLVLLHPARLDFEIRECVDMHKEVDNILAIRRVSIM